MTFRLAHISDIHLGPLPKVKRSDLISKRITGYLNWHRNRVNSMDDDSLDRLIQHMKRAEPDHVAVTGDLVNLALDEEIVMARKWLDALGPPRDVSVVPGNHDTYVPGALQKIIHSWKPYMLGDHDDNDGHPFPYRRDRGSVCIIGVNSGRATMPFMATGSFREEQARQLRRRLRDAREAELFRVVMIHHPPHPGATSAHKRLVGAGRFRDVIAQEGAELILHGHTHVDSFSNIEGPRGSVPVVGVPAASHGPALQDEKLGAESRKPGARYNIFDISGPPQDWQCHMQEYGFEGSSAEISLVREKDFAIPHK